MAPGRYFDNQDGPGGDRPRGNNEWRGGGDRGGSRGRGGGRGRGAPREGGRGGFGGDRGGRGGGGRGRGDGGRGRGAPRGRGNGRDGGRDRDDRPPKESFKAKEGFIAGGLKAYADTAAEAKLKKASGADDDAAGHQTTLYLTNLPASLTSPQLTLMFSSYAPVRAAFVVSSSRSSEPEAPAFGGANTISLAAGRDRTGKSTSRGFGYVRFVLRADAEQCLAEWGATAGFPHSVVNELRGQEGLQNVEWEKLTGAGGMKMSWAKKKLKDGEKPEGASADWKEKKPKGEKKEKKPVVLTEGDEIAAVDAADAPKWRPGVWDHNAPRTVIVFGLPLPGEAGSTEEEEEDESKEDESKEDESKKESEEKQVQEQEGEEKMAVDGEEGAAESAVPEAGPSKPKGKPIDWKKALKQRAKKLGDVEDVNYPYQLPTGEIAAMILMYTPKEAHAVQSKLNNHVFRGVLVSAAIKSSWDLCQKLGRQKGGGRLLVRNLGFDITVPDLRAAFARFGSLHSVTLPIDPKTNKPRGFAFIYYVGKPMAEAALKGVNGTRIYSGMAAERIASEGGKEGKKKEVREKKKAEKAQFQGGGGEKGRVVAVDWALSKEEWEKAQEEAKAAASASGSDSGSDSDSEEDSDEEDEDSDMTPVPEGDESEEEDDDSDTDPIPVGLDNDGQNEEKDSEDEESEDEKPKHEGTTLFVRNMSFEATEAELYDLFKSFGPVRYARIVYDPTTKRSRGTAFVCFWNEEHAWEVLRASRALNEGNFGETSNKRGNQSLLMADPSGSTASRLTLHGRVLAAVLAVSKGDADKLREDRDKKGAAKTDRRNLYLMREGVIFPSWAIAKTLSSADMDARQSSYDARKGLLRSNPSLYISRTRLAIRQIPLYVSDGMLKRLANHAIKEFERDTKGGFQKPLTDDEKLGFVADASGAKESSMKVERRKGIPLARVRQSKILRQNDRVDPVTGLGRSKGYGFLELGSHADALRVVRWANANKEVNRLFRGWWREALEKMIEDVENGEGKMGKGVKAKDKEDRLSRLREKQKELAEEEKLAEEKAAKREAAGKSTTGEDGRSSKCLIIEFSIENAVTTKRRAEKVDRAREKSKRAKERAENGEGSDESDDSDDEADAPQKGRNDKKGGPKRDLRGGPAVAGKKRRNDDDKAASPNKKRTKAAAVPEVEKTEGQRVGSMIGRKRKMKKGGK